MKRREFIKDLATLCISGSLLPMLRAQDRKVRVLYFTRSAGFEHSVVARPNEGLSHSEKILIELGKRAGFEVECTKDGSVFDGDLEQYAVVALYATGDLTRPDGPKSPPMTPKGKERFLEWVKNGGGVVGFHAATDAFHSRQGEVDPFLQMLGGEFLTHGAQQEATVRLVDPAWPGLDQVPKEIRLLEEWYVFRNFAPDLHVIFVQETKGMHGKAYERPPYPQTWARLHGKGRVFYTSFGHREDIWTNQIVQQIMLAGLAWAMKRVDADVTPNIEKVCPGIVAASRA